jgi:hypothetical protein
MLSILLGLAMAGQQAMPGLYRAHQIEVGAALLLKPDGHFQYQLDYGAVSEAAEGSWVAGDHVVFLTSSRMEGEWKEGEFAREPLILDGDTLLLRRYDIVIRFVRDTDEPEGKEDRDGE